MKVKSRQVHTEKLKATGRVTKCQQYKDMKKVYMHDCLEVKLSYTFESMKP